MGNEIQTKSQEYASLTMTNNFMFCKVMSNKDLCKEFLEVMLKIKIDHIEYINAEQEMSIAAGVKAVRLDVYVDDGTRTFDVEMQMVDTKDLAKRARYYQSLIDIDQTDKGMLYMELKESYVIFLMPNDAFKGELSRYTFENICRENPKIKLDDKTTKIFYNFNEYAKESDVDVRRILNYFATGEKSGGVTDRMQELLDNARNNSMWLSDYIRYKHDKRLAEYEAEQAKLQGYNEGKQLGIEQGMHDKAIGTARNMLADGMSVDMIAKYTDLPLSEITALQAENTATA